MNYEGIKCTATMDDGELLQGEFDHENKASFYSFYGKACVKFEIEDLDRSREVAGAAERIIKELSE